MRIIILSLLIFSVSLTEYFYNFEDGLQGWKEGDLFKRKQVGGKYGPQQVADQGKWFVGIPYNDKLYDETNIINDWFVSPEIDVSNYEECYISFYHWADFENSKEQYGYDGGIILINTHDKFPDDTWEQIDAVIFDSRKYAFPPVPKGILIPTYPTFVNIPELSTLNLKYAFQDTNGKNKGGKWIKVVSVDLFKAGYKKDKIKFAFCFFCNSHKGGGQGWFIDNFLVTNKNIALPMISNITNLSNTFDKGPYKIQAEITNAKEAKLHYALNDNWQELKLEVLNNKFEAQIPATSNNTLIKYYITAINDNGTNIRPNFQDGEFYSFKILPTSPQPDILLVNDDPCFGGRCKQDYFKALKDFNFDYTETPTLEGLKNYKIVIWFTAIQGGEETFTLPTDIEKDRNPNPHPLSLIEQQMLMEYLNSSTTNNVKKLILTGQCVLQGIEKNFMEAYLHISSFGKTYMQTSISGIDFLTYKFVNLAFEQNWLYNIFFKPMFINPLSPAQIIFDNRQGIRYSGNYKLIILPFEFSFLANANDEKDLLQEFISFLNPPPIPTNLTAVCNDKKVSLKWNTILNKPWIKYNVYKNSVLINTTNNPNYEDNDVVNDTIYNYKISITDGAEESEGIFIKVIPSQKPAIPSNLKAEVFEQSIKLNWDKINGVEGYYIYRSQDAKEYLKIGETKEINTTDTNTSLKNRNFIDNEVYNNITYFYKIRSHKNKNGIISSESEFSNEVTIILSKIEKNLTKIKVIPNPCYGDCIKFINLPDRAKIKIFTLTGELVDTIYYENTEGITTWNIKNLASGVYIYVIESLQDKIKGKFVVIR